MQPLSIYLILMMICQFSGCAKTTCPPASVAPITNVGALPAQKTQSELRVRADPYYSNRQKSMFGQDMSQTGLLPVMVYVQNNGVQPLKVTPNLISLEFQDGGEVQSDCPTKRPASASASGRDNGCKGRPCCQRECSYYRGRIFPLLTAFHSSNPSQEKQTPSPEGIRKQRATGGDSGQG